VTYAPPVSTEAVYWHHNDHLGTPQALTDINGTVVWTMSQTPFGIATVNEDPDGDGITVTNNFRFPGQYFDAETGLNYNYFRSYDPSTGRYTQHDPIGLNGVMNPFGYVNGNPVVYIDSYGLYNVDFATGFHLPISPGIAVGPLVSSSIKNYSSNPGNPLTANKTKIDIAAGVLADVGVAVGVSDLSGTGGQCAGYALNLGSGRYGGAQITFRKAQDPSKSIFNPLRYIDGVSIGLGLGIAAPISVSRGQ
jgi:RHS repeat-associated protein